MSKRTVKFYDNSLVSFEGRDTVLYETNGYSVSVVVEWEIGWFRSGGILELSSIRNWKTFPAGASSEIDETSKWRIIARVLEYFSQGGSKCRVAEGTADSKL